MDFFFIKVFLFYLIKDKNKEIKRDQIVIERVKDIDLLEIYSNVNKG